MEEIELNKTLEKSKLYLSDTPMYLDASSIISSSVPSENPDFRWLTKLKIHTSDAPILKELKDVLEQGCFTSHLLSFDNNKVLKIINWIC